jgi:hypothetical protein
MTRDRNNPERRGGADDSPRERPFAFGDGRLPPAAEGDDFDAWLAEHPAAHDDLADVSRLRELFLSVGPSEPEEGAWTAALNGIRAAIPNRRGWRRAPSPWSRLVLGMAAAAAVLCLALIGRSWWLSGPLPQPVLMEEPYPVVAAQDVTIISMDPHDVAALVVGEPPVTGELVFAQPDDVRVIKCERCPHSGNLPHLKRGEVPMFVTAVVQADNSDDE